MVSPVVDLRDGVVLSGGFPLLSGVTMSIDVATVTVVTGGNGAGKTSLLRLLAGLDRLSDGEGTVVGIDIRRGERRQLRRRVGWLGHEGSFYGDLSVRENLTFAAKALGRPVTDIDATLERVELLHRRDTPARQLSAGQRRRLGLAWLLLRRPELWLLDEPYASLDDAGRRFFDDVVVDVVRGGATVIVSAHDTLQTAAPIAQTLRMVGGRIAVVT